MNFKEYLLESKGDYKSFQNQLDTWFGVGGDESKIPSSWKTFLNKDWKKKSEDIVYFKALPLDVAKKEFPKIEEFSGSGKDWGDYTVSIANNKVEIGNPGKSL